MAKQFKVKLGRKTVSYPSRSACARELLTEGILSRQEIADVCGIKYQTVYRLDETYGIRQEANPMYAKASA